MYIIYEQMITKPDLADDQQMRRKRSDFVASWHWKPIHTCSWQLYLAVIWGFYLYVEKSSKNHKPKITEK